MHARRHRHQTQHRLEVRQLQRLVQHLRHTAPQQRAEVLRVENPLEEHEDVEGELNFVFAEQPDELREKGLVLAREQLAVLALDLLPHSPELDLASLSRHP